MRGCMQLGETALMKAAYSGRMQVVVGLVERGADTKLRAKVCDNGAGVNAV